MIMGKAWALGQTKIERGEDRSEFPSHERLVENRLNFAYRHV